jgi:hypothetical protein
MTSGTNTAAKSKATTTSKTTKKATNATGAAAPH